MLCLELVSIEVICKEAKRIMSPLKFVMVVKYFYYVKQRLNPKVRHQVTTSPLAGSHYALLDKRKEPITRENIFVPFGTPYVVKSMQAVHGIHT